MEKQIKTIKCPDLSFSGKEERILYILDQFDKWIRTPELHDLIRLFSAEEVPQTTDTISFLRWLKEFVKAWDYRGRQKAARTSEGENARWLIKGDDYINSHSEEIIHAAMALGMIGYDTTELDPDYILPLGGTIISNNLRNMQARRNRDQLESRPSIVCLSTMRLLSESEWSNHVLTDYALGSNFEFDSMCKAAERIYETGSAYQEERHDDEDPDRTWIILRYQKDYQGSPVTVIAAPSSDPDHRRANSADCFEFFFKRFPIKEGTKLLNVTGDMYCPYQQIRALSYAIQYNVVFDTVGYYEIKQPVSYLQEIKSTIDAMWDFVTRFDLSGS